ncbi:hypothetical protein BGZ89_003972 [Linnemannia elongata]|nr:hypothetical protein BGZ89_003972 [Linnemannia elongata]
MVPFKATERMKSIFQEKTLDDLRRSDEEWPDVRFDETLVTSAVRHCMRGQKGHLSEMDFTVKHFGPVMEASVDSACPGDWTYMRLKETTRGMFVLEEVCAFTIPVTVGMITSFMTNIQTLMIAQTDIEKIAAGPLDRFKRSWGYKGHDKNKRLLVQGFKGARQLGLQNRKELMAL